MNEPITVKVYDINNNEVNEFNSKNKCAQYYGITTYKLDEYALNNIAYNNMYFAYDKIPENYKKVNCDYCGKEFYCNVFRLNKSDKVYCSIECRDKSHEGENNCICPICGKAFHIEPKRIKKSNVNYCSQKCHYIAKKEYMKGEGNHQYNLKGELNASWKSNEKITHYGYRMIRCLEHPFKDSSDMVFEHRLVAEEFLLNDDNSIEINGRRYLKKEYVVHHINFNRLDNRLENLEVMLRTEHTLLHRSMEGNFFEFEEYCNKYNIDFEETYRQHLYNMEHYKYGN